MRVLFNPTLPASPHFETELELMLNHLEKGDTVYALTCNGDLASCLFNRDHLPSICDRCRSIIRRGLGQLPAGVRVCGYPIQAARAAAAIPKIGPRDLHELKRLAVSGRAYGLGIASTLISWENGELSIDTKKNAPLIERCLASSELVYQAMLHWLDALDPDLVYLFNGRFFTSFPAVLACETRGARYKTHERGSTTDKYDLSDNALPHEIAPATREVRALWSAADKASATRVAEQFFLSRQNALTAAIAIDSERILKRKMPPDFDGAKKNIVICNSSLTEFASIRGFDRPFGPYATEAEAVRCLASGLAAGSRREIHLYFRMHPLLAGADISQTRELLALEGGFPNLTIVRPDSDVDTYSLMRASDIVVVFHSTAGAEACFMGKPVVVLGHAAYRELGCVYTPDTRDEILALLRSELKPLPADAIVAYGFWLATHGMPYRYYQADGFYSGRFRGVRICEDTRPWFLKARSKLRDVRALSDIPALIRWMFAALVRRIKP